MRVAVDFTLRLPYASDCFRVSPSPVLTLTLSYVCSDGMTVRLPHASDCFRLPLLGVTDVNGEYEEVRERRDEHSNFPLLEHKVRWLAWDIKH